MLVVFPSNPKTARIVLDGDFGENSAHVSCSGHIEMTANRIGPNTYTAFGQGTAKASADEICRVGITLRGTRAVVTEESYGCALWRGTCASFSGHARRVFP